MNIKTFATGTVRPTSLLDKPDDGGTRLVIPGPAFEVVLADLGARLEGVPHPPAGIEHQADVVDRVTMVLALAFVTTEEDCIACFALLEGHFPIDEKGDSLVRYSLDTNGEVGGIQDVLVLEFGRACAVHIPGNTQILLEEIPPGDLADGPAHQARAVESLGAAGWSGARPAAESICKYQQSLDTISQTERKKR